MKFKCNVYKKSNICQKSIIIVVLNCQTFIQLNLTLSFMITCRVLTEQRKAIIRLHHELEWIWHVDFGSEIVVGEVQYFDIAPPPSFHRRPLVSILCNNCWNCSNSIYFMNNSCDRKLLTLACKTNLTVRIRDFLLYTDQLSIWTCYPIPI